MIEPAGFDPPVALCEISCGCKYAVYAESAVPGLEDEWIFCVEHPDVDHLRVVDVISAQPLDPKMRWAIQTDVRESSLVPGAGQRHPSLGNL